MKIKKTLVISMLCMALGGGMSLTASASPEPQAATTAQLTATGTVYDSTGEPVIGASVRQAGKPANGVATDMDGKYTLTVPAGAKIEISYVGCKTATVTPGHDVQTTLEDDAQMLDDVVVVGFATQKKVNLTGAVSVASGKDLADRPVNTATEALQGLIPGLQLTRNSGDVETTMSIQVRGTGTTHMD